MSSNAQDTCISTSCPNKEGWVAEYEDAQKAAKKSKSKKSHGTAEVQLRLAIAARTLRQWEVCREASHAGLKLCNSANTSPTRQQLLECQTQAKKELSVKSVVDDLNFKNKILPTVWDSSVAIDRVHTFHSTYSNLNILQCAAVNGDVRLLERVVALGAALDFPPSESPTNVPPPHDFPQHAALAPHMVHKSATALVLVCANLAAATKAKHIMPPMPNQPELVQCAILLVMLGASTEVKLTQPEPEHCNNMATKILVEMDLYGKTAYELGLISKHKELIQAMKDLKPKESRIAKCYCRCGSRLPWYECHGFPRTGESPYYFENRGDLLFRYSPLAPCHCKTTGNKKTHFACCWKGTAKPYYQHDALGQFMGNQRIPINMNDPVQAQMVGLMKLLKEMRTGDEQDDRMFPDIADMSPQERRASTVQMMRSAGPFFFQQLIASNGPKCQMRDWDMDVYLGTFERLDNEFHWKDCHWQLDKVELLKRVDEWNTALAQYCDHVGLTGQKREQVIQKHSANPCAPCANLSCTNFETKCKEFSRCSRCKLVSYCSAACQRQDWKDHKKKCLPS